MSKNVFLRQLVEQIADLSQACFIWEQGRLGPTKPLTFFCDFLVEKKNPLNII